MNVRRWQLYCNVWIPIIAVSLVSSVPSFSQTGKLTLTGGGIQIIVNSLSQYNDGVSLPNWTRVKIAYTGNTGDLDWQLRVESLYPFIMSDGSDPGLSLDYLKFVLINVTPIGTTWNAPGDFDLLEQPNGSVLIEGTGTNNFEITFGITYQLGMSSPPSLMNVPWGYYYTNLHFWLEYFP